MRRKILIGRIMIFIGVLSLFSFKGFSAEPPQTDQAKQTIALVDKAAGSSIRFPASGGRHGAHPKWGL
jgi:hypothetical protein